MAKKKKHRKSSRSRKQRLQVGTASSPESNAAASVDMGDTLPTKASVATQPEKKPLKSKNELTYDDVDLGYVKSDIRKTLILLGAILAFYVIIWILMTYTSLGTQALHIFSR